MTSTPPGSTSSAARSSRASTASPPRRAGAGTWLLKNLIWCGNGLSSGRTLLNFPEAVHIDILGSTLDTSILAPFACLQFDNGLITGQIAAKTLNGQGQVNSFPFDVCIDVP